MEKRCSGAIRNIAPNLWATDTRWFERVVTVGDNWIGRFGAGANYFATRRDLMQERFPGSGEKSPRRIEG